MWNDFWFRPEHRLNFVVARALLALNALWIVLSRPRLPDLFRWPAGFWSHIDPAILHRFLVFPIGARLEWALYIVLAGALIAAAAGVMPRTACFVSGVLLYHFAALEDILSSDGPYFRGLGVPLLGLLILAFSAHPRSDPSPEYRWPLVLTQVLFVFTYFFSGIAKLFVPGVTTWISRQHFLLIVGGRSSPDAVAPWGHFFFDHPLLAAVVPAGILILDLAMITVVFSKRAAWVLIPLAMVMHALSPNIVGVIFLNAPLLLLFVDWPAALRALARRGNRAAMSRRDRTAPGTPPPSAGPDRAASPTAQ